MASNKSQTIFRSTHRRNYTVVSNELLSEPSLSGKAKWVLLYLLSKPEDWKTRIEDIVKHGTDGRAAILSAIKELKTAGYLSKVAVRDDQGRIDHWETLVYEHPSQNPTFQHLENQHQANQHLENQTLQSTDSIQSTDQKESNEFLTTTEASGSSEKQTPLFGIEASAQELEQADKDVEWVLSALSGICSILKPTEALRLACVRKSDIEILMAMHAFYESWLNSNLKMPQGYLESAIRGRWVPSQPFVDNSVEGRKLTAEQIAYAARRRNEQYAEQERISNTLDKARELEAAV